MSISLRLIPGRIARETRADGWCTRLYRRVIREPQDLEKLATSLGFTFGATLVVLLAWALK